MCEKIDAANLADIAAINVDKNLPRKERVTLFKKQIKDTNLYKCEGFTIRAIYSANGGSIEDCLREMMA